jgi:hypothetical protein
MGYDTEPDEAVYALGDGLGPVRRLPDECREGMLAANRPQLEEAA